MAEDINVPQRQQHEVELKSVTYGAARNKRVFHLREPSSKSSDQRLGSLRIYSRLGRVKRWRNLKSCAKR